MREPVRRNLYWLFCEIRQRFNILLSVEKKYGKVISEQMFINKIKKQIRKRWDEN